MSEEEEQKEVDEELEKVHLTLSDEEEFAQIVAAHPVTQMPLIGFHFFLFSNCSESFRNRVATRATANVLSRFLP